MTRSDGAPTVAGRTFPGLVDAGCGVVGYRETLLDDPSTSSREIGRLLRAFGVVAVRESGNGLDATSRFRHACGPSVVVVGGGPVLIDGPARSEGDRPVADEAHLRRSLDALVVEGVGWVSVRSDSEDFVAAVAGHARVRGLSVAARGAAALPGAGRGQVHLVEGLAATLRPGSRLSAADRLASLADGDPAALARDVVDGCAAGAAVTTELLATRRAAFVKESLTASYLDELGEILPHSKQFLQMRRPGAFLAGKRYLSRYSGLAEPTAEILRRADRGWAVLLEVAARVAAAGVGLLPASRAPQLAVVPGAGLREEIATLVLAGVHPTAALRAASGTAAAVLGVAQDVLDRAHLTAVAEPAAARDVLDLGVTVGPAAEPGLAETPRG